MHQPEDQRGDPKVMVKMATSIPNNKFLFSGTVYERLFLMELFATILLFFIGCVGFPFILGAMSTVHVNDVSIVFFVLLAGLPFVAGCVASVSLWALATNHHRKHPQFFAVVGAIPTLWFLVIFLTDIFFGQHSR